MLLLLVLPAAVYVAGYSFYFAAGHSLGEWWTLQRQAYLFDIHANAPHPYASTALTWIVDLHPISGTTSNWTPLLTAWWP